jgi:hypothetical protein
VVPGSAGSSKEASEKGEATTLIPSTQILDEIRAWLMTDLSTDFSKDISKKFVLEFDDLDFSINPLSTTKKNFEIKIKDC